MGEQNGGIPRISGDTQIRDRGTLKVRTLDEWSTGQAQQFGDDLEWGRSHVMNLIDTGAMFVVDSEPDKAFLAHATREANANLMRRWFTDGWLGKVNPRDVFDPNFKTNGVVVGPEGPRSKLENRLTGFPDLSVVVEELITVGDRAIIRLLWRGTHTGPYSGVPPTGKPVQVRVVSIWRFENGRAIETWTVQDQFALLQQVGVISPDIKDAQVRL